MDVEQGKNPDKAPEQISPWGNDGRENGASRRLPVDGEKEKLRRQRGEREGRDGAQRELDPELRQAGEYETGV